MLLNIKLIVLRTILYLLSAHPILHFWHNFWGRNSCILNKF